MAAIPGRRRRVDDLAECRDTRLQHGRESNPLQYRRLLWYWPAGLHDPDFSVSGINCYIVVARVIYGEMPQSYWDRTPETPSPWDEDPILQQAWLDFGLPTSRDHGKALDNLLDRLGETSSALHHRPTEYTFETLINSPKKMPLWTLDGLHPFRGLYWANGEGPWKIYKPDAPDAVDRRYRRIDQTLYPYDMSLVLSGGMDLSDTVKSRFEMAPDDMYRYFRRPTKAPLMYFTGTISCSQEQPLRWSDIRQFSLADMFTADDEPRWYSIAAMVVLRSDVKDSDRVRVWDDNCMQIVPHSTMTYATQDWSVADLVNGTRVFLLYRARDDRLTFSFPERYVKRAISAAICLLEDIIDEEDIADEDIADEEDG